MHASRANGGYSGMEYDRWVEQRASDSSDKSAMTKLQQQFWVTKQTVFRKLGKKEDECIVASDAELDAKLELFRSIQESCQDLQRIIDKYQERLCILAQEESAMGRFLKDASRSDKTQAGKMMAATGKSLAYSGQQRLALRVPLLRLHQEVDTFRARAVEDTQGNVRAMEKMRTEYRAALGWMKQVSSELDPDTFQQLDKFRKVQNEVRRSKARFERLKSDCVQKIDLLTAARCNMFSHALVLYQAALTHFAANASHAFAAVATAFQGQQHYEFCVVKELSELSEPTSSPPAPQDDDKLLFFEPDFQDEPETPGPTSGPLPLLDFDVSSTLEGTMPPSTFDPSTSGPALVDLTDLSLGQRGEYDGLTPPLGVMAPPPSADLADWGGGASELALLEEILGAVSSAPVSSAPSAPAPKDLPAQAQRSVLPSHLLAQAAQPTAVPKERRAWLDLFAELDPLSDPDTLAAGASDRNC